MLLLLMLRLLGLSPLLTIAIFLTEPAKGTDMAEEKPADKTDEKPAAAAEAGDQKQVQADKSSERSRDRSRSRSRCVFRFMCILWVYSHAASYCCGVPGSSSTVVMPQHWHSGC
jgi:hypothetical protein